MCSTGPRPTSTQCCATRRRGSTRAARTPTSTTTRWTPKSESSTARLTWTGASTRPGTLRWRSPISTPGCCSTGRPCAITPRDCSTASSPTPTGAAWLRVAHELADHIEESYADPLLGGYFDRSGGDELGRLGERIKPLTENSVAAMALIELDVLEGDPASPLRERSRRALESVAALPRQYGLMAAAFARALDRSGHAVKITTKNPELARAGRLAHPYAVIDPRGDARAVVCVGTICLAPVTTPEAVVEAVLKASQRTPGSASEFAG